MSIQSSNIELNVQTCNSPSDLQEMDQELLAKAKVVATQAYAPYSHFRVGSALRLKNGSIVTGSNQENAAYPSGLCAERVAMFAAGATFPNEAFSTIAIYAKADKFELESAVTPCGACRQVMSEYEDLSGQKLKIIMANDREIIVVNGIDTLLPLRFHLPKK